MVEVYAAVTVAAVAVIALTYKVLVGSWNIRQWLLSKTSTNKEGPTKDWPLADLPGRLSEGGQILSQIREGLRSCFTPSELEDLCFALQIDIESLPGQGKNAKTRELVLYVARRGKLLKLIEYSKQNRPLSAWPTDEQLDALSNDPNTSYLRHLLSIVNEFLVNRLEIDEESSIDLIKLTYETKLLSPDLHLATAQQSHHPLLIAGGVERRVTPRVFQDFESSFSFLDRRAILLGSLGSGKTITLLAYAQQSILRRLQDPNEPLPIILLASTWAADETNLAQKRSGRLDRERVWHGSWRS